MGRKRFYLLSLLLLTFLGLTLVKHWFPKDIGLFFLTAILASLLLSSFPIFAWNLKQKSREVDSKDFSPKKIKRIYKALFFLSQKAKISVPVIKIIESNSITAYTYQLLPGKGVVYLSSALVRDWSVESIKGILAHELIHLRERDSWKNFWRINTTLFFLLMSYFIIPQLTYLILWIALVVEIIKYREREYFADVEAVKLTGLSPVLHYMLDGYSQMKREEFKLKEEVRRFQLLHQWLNQVRQKIKLAFYQGSIALVNHLSTHPSWEKRIIKILNSRSFLYRDHELQHLLAKVSYLRFKQNYQYPINWHEFGLIGQKIVKK